MLRYRHPRFADGVENSRREEDNKYRDTLGSTKRPIKKRKKKKMLKDVAVSSIFIAQPRSLQPVFKPKRKAPTKRILPLVRPSRIPFPIMKKKKSDDYLPTTSEKDSAQSAQAIDGTSNPIAALDQTTMPGGKRRTKADTLQKKRETERLRREKIKNNPELYDEHKAKERARYHDRKQKDSIKRVAQLTKSALEKTSITNQNDINNTRPGKPNDEGESPVKMEDHVKKENQEDEQDLPLLFCESEEVYIKVEPTDEPDCLPEGADLYCDKCDFKTLEPSILRLHQNRHRSKGPYSCSMCEYVAKTRRYLEMHIRTHTGERPYACDVCDFRSAQPSGLKYHKRKHTGEKPYFCDMCSYRCNRLDTLRDHKTTHKVEPDYCCGSCQFKTSRRRTLVLHMRTHTGEKPYACNLCDYRAIEKRSLTIHIRSHSEGQSYICEACDFKCSKRGELTHHHRTHQGFVFSQRTYSCDMCDFKSTHLGTLKAHKNRHLGERPFACDQCEYRASQRSALSRHILTHSGDRPYFCSMCDYRAARPSTLKLHVRRHTGERPYTCDICDFTCGRLDILKTHKTSTHTGEHPYACDLCSYTCVRADKLKTHQKKYHSLPKVGNTNDSSHTVEVKLDASEVDERLGSEADCQLELSLEAAGDCQNASESGNFAVDVSVPVIKIEPGVDVDSQQTFELSGITVSNAMTFVSTEDPSG